MLSLLKMSVPKGLRLCHQPIIALLLTGLMFSCSPAPSRAPDVFYDLTVHPVEQTYGSTASLSISSVAAQGVMSGRSFVTQTSTDPVTYAELRGHLWHIPPSQLLQTALIDALSAGSTDLQVGTSDALTSPDYRLKLRLRQFSFTPQGDAVVSFDAVIKSRQSDVLLTGVYSAAHPVNGSAADDAVRAYQTAVQDIAAQLSTDIAGLF